MAGLIGPKNRHHLVVIQDAAALPQDSTKWRGAMIYLIDDGTATAASKVLTIAAGNAAHDDTVTIDGTTYRFRTGDDQAEPTEEMLQAYDVLISAVDNDGTVANLVAAINASGTEGVEYFAGTLEHPTVSAGAESGDGTTTITAKVTGSAANAIAVSESGANISWAGGATALSGGLDAPCIAIGNTAGDGWDLFSRTGTA